VLAVGLTVPTLRRIGPPPPQAATEHPLRLALRVTAGAGLVLAGLTAGAPLAGAALVAAGVVIGAPALVRLLPAGSLRARPGLPAAVLSKGLLTFAFFGADTYVPLAITSVGGYSPTVGGLAVTAATLSWTAASWVQERVATIATGRRLVVIGLLTVAAGIAATLVSLLPGAPAWLAVAAWGVGGFGVGLAYTPIALIVLKEAPPGQEGTTSASMQLTENLGVALGAGVGGALVAAADAGGWSPRAGLTAVFTLTGTAALLSIIVARRLPATTVPAREPGSPASQPGR
jgi:MFS family permease